VTVLYALFFFEMVAGLGRDWQVFEKEYKLVAASTDQEDNAKNRPS